MNGISLDRWSTPKSPRICGCRHPDPEPVEGKGSPQFAWTTKNKKGTRSRGPSKPNVIPLSRSNPQLRPVHLYLHPPILIPPSIIRHIKFNLVSENPTIHHTPQEGFRRRKRRINHPGILHHSRPAQPDAKRSNRLHAVIIQNGEILLLKIPDTIPSKIRHHHIKPHTPGIRPTPSQSPRHAHHRTRNNHHSSQSPNNTPKTDHELTSHSAISIPGPLSHSSPRLRATLMSHDIFGRRHSDPELAEGEESLYFARTTSTVQEKTQSNLQSTTTFLTRTINLTHTEKVRRTPDFTI